MKAIYKKELQSYFHSFLGPLLIGAFLLLLGIYFAVYDLFMGYPYIGYALSSVTFLFLIAIPVLCMKILAEERHQKTDQLILTSPVSVTGIVLGKFLALATIFAIPVGLVSLYPVVMSFFGTVDIGKSYLAVFGFLLYGLASIAVCVFISSLTESQVIAAVLTFVLLFAFYMMNGISSFFSKTSMSTCVTFGLLILAAAIIVYTMIKNVLISAAVGVIGEVILVIVYLLKSSIFEGGIQKVLDIFNLSGHFDNFTNNIFDIKGIVYFLSVIAVCLFLTMQSILKRRWN